MFDQKELLSDLVDRCLRVARAVRVHYNKFNEEKSGDKIAEYKKQKMQHLLNEIAAL